MMSSLFKYITTVGVISWLLMHNINSAGSAEIPPSDCILLIGGYGMEKTPIEYYNPDDGVECDRKHFAPLNFLAQHIPIWTCGCYFADTQQIVVREDYYRRNASVCDLQDGSIKDIPAAQNSKVVETTSSPSGPSRCLSCGGYDYSKRIRVNNCYEFDVTANKWTHILPLPSATRGAASVSLGHFYYVMGGYHKSFSDKLHRYDTTQKEWTTIQSMNSKRYGHSAVQLSDEEFITCGGHDGNGYVASCEVYSNVTQKWRKVASMNTARSAFALVGFNGQIYAIGGEGDKTVEVYNSVNDSWAMVYPLKLERKSFVAFAVTLRPPPTTTTPSSTTSTPTTPSSTTSTPTTPTSTTSTPTTTTPQAETSNYDTPEAATTTGAATPQTATSTKMSPGMITIICLAGVIVVIVPLTVVLACLYCRKRRAKRSRVTAKNKREESEMDSSTSEPTPKKKGKSSSTSEPTPKKKKAEEPRLKDYADGTETETTDEPSDYNELDTVTSHRIDASLPTDGEY